MRKLLLTLSFVSGILGVVGATKAGGITVFYRNGEKIDVHRELPESATINGEHVNWGVKYSQFSLFWIPMFNYGDVEWVMVNDAKTTYWDMDDDFRAALKEAYNLYVSDEPVIGFWNRIGGKLIWGALLVLILWQSLVVEPRKKRRKGFEVVSTTPK